MISALLVLLGCWGKDTYIVEGTVVELQGHDQVLLDHEKVDGLGMPAMVMAFRAHDPALLEGLEPGHRVVARFEILENGGQLTKVRITGKGPPPAVTTGPSPLKPGQVLPRTEVVVEDGTRQLLGEGQGRPTLLTFLYTRCPLPEFCPATVARFQALQGAAPEGVRLLAVTLDPEHDTPAVLKTFADGAGADPAVWRFAVSDELGDLALYAGLTVVREGDGIAHGLRVLALDADGRLIRRFDDLAFSSDEAFEGMR
ncbi:MAG: copper-binding protein [Myxococcales bacterium]|nr:copper-binding protein [Myxococcales bacterium]MCB9691548.1 copper-binding protein [Alphaproteobacteria bacterium]